MSGDLRGTDDTKQGKPLQRMEGLNFCCLSELHIQSGRLVAGVRCPAVQKCDRQTKLYTFASPFLLSFSRLLGAFAQLTSHSLKLENLSFHSGVAS